MHTTIIVITTLHWILPRLGNEITYYVTIWALNPPHSSYSTLHLQHIKVHLPEVLTGFGLSEKSWVLSASLAFGGNSGRPLTSAAVLILLCCFEESGSVVRSSTDPAPMYFSPSGLRTVLSNILSASITAVWFCRCSAALVTDSTHNSIVPVIKQLSALRLSKFYS